jgi:uncharacterized OB-fold protein
MAIASRPLREGLFEVDPPALVGSRCTECGASHFPPKAACPDCHAADVVAERLPTRGSIRTFTVVRNAPSLFRQPYMLAYVQLHGSNLQVFAQLSDVEGDDVSIGMPVELRIGPLFDEDDGQRQVVAYTFAPVPRSEA